MIGSWILAIAFFWSAVGLAEGVVSEDFSIGNQWTWAYSEELHDVWQEPYIFETYTVVNRIGSLAQIEMSSSDKLSLTGEPHHYFVVDLEDCFRVRGHVGRLNKLKIQFYTRSHSDRWELVSRRHPGLAFTEKFNCLDSKLPRKQQTYESPLFGTLDLFQWRGLKVHSWYNASEQEAPGVAILRFTRNYRMELVKRNQTQNVDALSHH